MKNIFLILIVFLISFYSIYAQVRVRSYFRKDGTFVQSHYRTYPDGNVYNNWSTKGNINPYTGKEGTIDPYKYSIPKTRVYSNYIQYPYTSTNNNFEKIETIKEVIRTNDSKEYIIVRKKDSKSIVPINSKRRIIIYE